jgi:hypothetical protein
MPEVHKRAKSLDLRKELSTTTLLEEPRFEQRAGESRSGIGRCRQQEDVRDFEEIIKSLREENKSLREENAALELCAITSKLAIRPDCWTSLRFANDSELGLLVPIQCQVGESVLQAENRMLKEQITKLQYISRIWDRYTAELHILQRENQRLKDIGRGSNLSWKHTL